MTADIRIRRATEDDAARLARLNRHVQDPHVAAEPAMYRATDSEEVAQFFRARLTEAVGLIAEAPAPCGYVLCMPIRRDATPFTHPRAILLVDQIAVDPACRRMGVGVALMVAAEALATELGLEAVELDVRATNDGARAFYEALGYAPAQLRLRKARP